MKEKVKDWKDEDEVKAYLQALLDKKAFDKAGLIYGMGHAVYSLSDPRANILRSFVEKLSKEKGRTEEYDLYSMVERLGPEVISGGSLRHRIMTPVWPAGAPTALRSLSTWARLSARPISTWATVASTGLWRSGSLRHRIMTKSGTGDCA